jgi:hypothetical protein
MVGVVVLRTAVDEGFEKECSEPFKVNTIAAQRGEPQSQSASFM